MNTDTKPPSQIVACHKKPRTQNPRAITQPKVSTLLTIAAQALTTRRSGDTACKGCTATAQNPRYVRDGKTLTPHESTRTQRLRPRNGGTVEGKQQRRSQETRITGRRGMARRGCGSRTSRRGRGWATSIARTARPPPPSTRLSPSSPLRCWPPPATAPPSLFALSLCVGGALSGVCSCLPPARCELRSAKAQEYLGCGWSENGNRCGVQMG